MSVRPGAIRDLPAILAVERAVPDAPHWSEADYRKIWEANECGTVKRSLFVWEAASGMILGFAVGMLLDVTGHREGQLENIVVAHSARRVGIGRALCAAVLVWGVQGGAKFFELEVREQNLEAIRLYQGLGFRTTGKRSAYYRNPSDDAILMKCTFADDVDAA